MLEKTSEYGFKSKTKRQRHRENQASRTVDGPSTPKSNGSDATARPQFNRAGAITGLVDRLTDNAIEGWAIDRHQLERHLQVRAMVDGKEIGSTTCNRYREDIHKSGAGDGRYGFRFECRDTTISGDRISVVVVDSDPPVRLPIARHLLDPVQVTRPAAYAGFVDKVNASEVTGWALDRNDLSKRLRIRAVVNGQCVGEGRCTLFRGDLLKFGAGDGRYGFRITLDIATLHGELVVTIDEGAEPHRLSFTPDAAGGLQGLRTGQVELQPPAQLAISERGALPPNEGMAALQAQVQVLHAELARLKGALSESVGKLGLNPVATEAVAPLQQALGISPTVPPEQVSWRARGIYRQLLRRLEAGI